MTKDQLEALEIILAFVLATYEDSNKYQKAQIDEHILPYYYLLQKIIKDQK